LRRFESRLRRGFQVPQKIFERSASLRRETRVLIEGFPKLSIDAACL
jgi:hypothetical protein